MQKAIYYAGDLKIERKEKVEYMLLIDERTKNVKKFIKLVNSK